jgi:hypothetical protein
MLYIFDSSSLINLFRHYYPKRFPTLWNYFENSLASGNIISVKEVYNEIQGQNDKLCAWAKTNSSIFLEPTEEEMLFVVDIFRIPHFQAIVRQKEIFSGKPVADPFIIAKAKASNGSVITEEQKKDNAAKIPNICAHFHIECYNLEGFMEKENWEF